MNIFKKPIYSGTMILGFLLGSGLVFGQSSDLNLKEATLQTRTLEGLRGVAVPPGEEYTIGDGDEIDIQVVSRPELSGHHLVGPDGRITLPLCGSFEIKGLSRGDAAKGITKGFEKYYTTIDVTVRVTKYGSNRILVLGHVARPGVLYFDNAPNLLEALSKSGAGTTKGANNDPSLPQRCAIFRGKDLLAWIDLKSMLERGDSLADLRLRRDDVLYVPDEQDILVSVLGEVQHPGMVKLEPKASLLDVLALSGGLTADSGRAKIEVVRQDRSTREFAFHDLLNPAKAVDFPLQRGDVIYVAKGSMAKFEYALKKLSPLATLMVFGTMMGATFQ